MVTEDDGPDDTAVAEEASEIEVDAESEAVSGDDVEAQDAKNTKPLPLWCRIEWSRVVAFGVLPVVAFLIGALAGFLKWQDVWTRASGVAGTESVAAAKESTVALLSYQPDSVEKDLGGARDRLTGKFKDSYTQLIHDVVIPAPRRIISRRSPPSRRRLGVGDTEPCGDVGVRRPDRHRR
ncbi:hypothetical protein I553_5099 [Mycobacterium xenopi 4042]|uniref:Uncharacterized protein n=1 Tax=Mycobacterium xenopi 4042 TaxID=1299334 RepID=X7ZVV3_MYCXE|nr:hypothetical protein I553_5099 [Mycobacterium xenopi 4042]